MAKPARPRRFLPVWAMVEGEKPVVNGKVRILTGRGGRVQRIKVRGIARTGRQGSVALDPVRVPSAFTVVVRGGTVAGKRFNGRLETAVRNYEAGDGITINPVTTLIAGYQRAHPGLKPRVVTKRVKRYLDIPAHHDPYIDLRRSDVYFDGDVLLDRVGRRSMQKLVRANVAAMDRGGRHAINPFRTERRARPVATRSTNRSEIQSNPRALGGVEEVGASWAAKQILSGALSGIGGQAADFVVGNVLSALGLGGDGAEVDAKLAQISSQLTQITSDLANIEGDVNQVLKEITVDRFTKIKGDLDAAHVAIDQAEDKFSYLLTLEPNSANQARIDYLSKELLDEIEKSIMPIGGMIALKLSGDQGLIQAAYNVQYSNASDPKGATYPFFTSDNSVAPRQLLDFYTSLQALQAMFIAEYYQGTKNPLTDDDIKYKVQPFYDAVISEVAALKPLVGNGELVDTTPGGRLWFAAEGNTLPCDPGSSPPVHAFTAVQNGQTVGGRFNCGANLADGLTPYWFFQGQAQRVTADPQNQSPEFHPSVQLDTYVPPFASTYYDPSTHVTLTLPQQPRTAKLADIQTLASVYGKAGFSSVRQLMEARGFQNIQTDNVFANTTNTPNYNSCRSPGVGYPYCPAYSLSRSQAYETRPTNNGQNPGTGGIGMLFVADITDGGFW